MAALLVQLERYADATGGSYHLVTSCTNIASTIIDSAPGHAIALARRALLWAPSHDHAWAVRAAALDRLGRPDPALRTKPLKKGQGRTALVPGPWPPAPGPARR